MSRSRQVIGELVVRSIITKKRSVVVAVPDDADHEELSDLLYEKLTEDDIEWEIIDECCENLIPTEDGELLEVSQADERGAAQFVATRGEDGELTLKPSST